MKKVLLSLLIIFIVLITSCSVGVGSVKTYRNNEVDLKILDSVKILDDKVLDSINNNDVNKIIEISSESLKNDSKNLKELLGGMYELMKEKSFDYKDRYYCKVSKVGKYSFSIETLEDDPFTINVEAMSKDIFVSVIKSNSKINDYLISLLYIKEQGKWKLTKLNIGEYSYDGMTVNDLYEKTKLLDTKGYKMPAALYSILSDRLLHSAPFLQYKKESEITSYYKNLTDNLKKYYIFPYKLKDTNNVEICGFDVRCVKEGLIPVIKYKTDINLSSYKEVEKEANDINEEVVRLYSGLKENFKFFLYEAYSEFPVDPKINYKFYGIVVEQK